VTSRRGTGKLQTFFYSVHTTSASPLLPFLQSADTYAKVDYDNVVTGLRLYLYTFSDGAILLGKTYEARLKIMPLSSLIICYLASDKLTSQRGKK
jgi:hypothetical protein